MRGGGEGERCGVLRPSPPQVVTEDSAKFEFYVCFLPIFVVSIYKKLLHLRSCSLRLGREFKPNHNLT